MAGIRGIMLYLNILYLREFLLLSGTFSVAVGNLFEAFCLLYWGVIVNA